MIEPLRQSVLTNELERYYYCGWAYIMPDFDKPNHSIVEWLSEKMPVYPISKSTAFNSTDNKANAEHERAGT